MAPRSQPPDDHLVTRRELLDSAGITRALRRIASEIVEKNAGQGGLALVGIRTGGYFLAERLARLLAEVEPERLTVALGAVDITLLHCVSAYPTPAAEANLSAIQQLRDMTGLKVGWSDHTRRPAVIERAVHRWGASAIEFHLDLDGEGAEYAAGHCWLPDEIAPVIARIRESGVADGNGFKGPQPSELSDRDWRADPVDGMRPLRHIRLSYRGEAA